MAGSADTGPDSLCTRHSCTLNLSSVCHHPKQGDRVLTGFGSHPAEEDAVRDSPDMEFYPGTAVSAVARAQTKNGTPLCGWRCWAGLC